MKQLTIFGAEWCTFCKQAVELAKSYGYQYTYIDADAGGEAAKKLMESFFKKENIIMPKSIPQIFISSDDGSRSYIGGFSELAKQHLELFKSPLEVDASEFSDVEL